MKEIVLQNDVRYFERAYGPQSLLLRDIGRSLSKNGKVWVGDPITMCWDHRDVLAVPFEWGGNEGFLLHEEVASSLDVTATPLIN